MTEVAKKRISFSKVAIIILLALILILTAAILFFVVSNDDAETIMKVFKSNGEYTMNLEEFIVNLKPEGNIRHYLKISMALMYGEEAQGATIDASIYKIRDAVITQIRTRTYTDIIGDENAIDFKEDVKVRINEALGEDIIKAIYITDIVVQ